MCCSEDYLFECVHNMFAPTEGAKELPSGLLNLFCKTLWHLEFYSFVLPIIINIFFILNRF